MHPAILQATSDYGTVHVQVLSCRGICSVVQWRCFAWVAASRSLLRARLRGGGRAVEDFDRDRLRGTTGRLGNPSWWTWEATAMGPPVDGQSYLLELALPEWERFQAENDGVLVEIALSTVTFTSGCFAPLGWMISRPRSSFDPTVAAKNPSDELCRCILPPRTPPAPKR